MATTDVEVLQINTQPSVKSLASLKQEIKDLKSQLLSLDEGTEEYNQTLSELGDKMHQIKEVNEQAAMTNSDLGTNLANTSKALAGMSGAVSAVTGSLSLMGVEMGDDAKLMKTLVSAMSVTQGIAAMESGVKAVKALGTSIKNAIVQQKLFNTTALKNPYILLAAAIIAAITAIIVAIKKQKDAEEEQHKARMKQLQEQYDFNIKMRSDAAKTEAELVKLKTEAAHWTQEEIDKKREQLKLENEIQVAAAKSYDDQIAELRDKIAKQEAWNKDLEKSHKLQESSVIILQKEKEELNKLVTARNDYANAANKAKREWQALGEVTGKTAEKVSRTTGKTISDIKQSVKGKDIFDLQMATIDGYEKKLEKLQTYIRMQTLLVIKLHEKLKELGGEDFLNFGIDLKNQDIKMMPNEVAEAALAYRKAYKVLRDLQATEAEMKETEKERVRLNKEINIEAKHEMDMSNNTVINLREQIKLLKKEGEIQRENNNIEDQQFWNPNAKNNLNDIQQQAEQQQLLAELKFQVTQHGLDMEYKAQKEYYESLQELYKDDTAKQLEITNTLSELQAQYNYDKLANEEELKNRSLEIAQEERDAKVALVNSYLDAYQSMSSAITGILGSIADTQEQGTKEWKNLKTAEAIINTLAGGVSAFMSGVNSGIPAPYNLILAATMATSTLAAGFAEVKKIQDTKVSKSSSSSSVRQATVQTISNNPSNVRTTNPQWNDEGQIENNITETNTTVTLVTSDLEALNSQNVNIQNNNSF